MRLIDVDALIEDCKRYLNTLNPDRDGNECTRIHWLIGVLENATTIEPEPHWIPVSERLPDEYGEYLVTKHTIGWNCEEYISNDIAYFDNDGFHKADTVTAWMPLPKPYGGES